MIVKNLYRPIRVSKKDFSVSFEYRAGVDTVDLYQPEEIETLLLKGFVIDLKKVILKRDGNHVFKYDVLQENQPVKVSVDRWSADERGIAYASDVKIIYSDGSSVSLSKLPQVSPFSISEIEEKETSSSYTYDSESNADVCVKKTTEDITVFSVINGATCFVEKLEMTLPVEFKPSYVKRISNALKEETLPVQKDGDEVTCNGDFVFYYNKDNVDFTGATERYNRR